MKTDPEISSKTYNPDDLFLKEKCFSFNILKKKKQLNPVTNSTNSKLQKMSSFSPDTFDPHTASVLNTIEGKLDTMYTKDSCARRFPFHKPEGTPLEADLMLSCTGLKWSVMGRVLKNYEDVMEDSHGSVNCELLSLFVPKRRCGKYRKLRHYKQIVETIFESRGAIKNKSQRLYPSSSTNAFSDLLFGPHVAKVLNALLEWEIQMAEGKWHTYYHLCFEDQNNEPTNKMPFALINGRGTAFAADLLLAQHAFHEDDPETEDLSFFLLFSEPNHGDFGLMDALFPMFKKLPADVKRTIDDYRNFNHFFGIAIGNVRAEMHFITTTIDRYAVPTLMAGIPRLGGRSHLGMIDREVLCMIVRMMLVR